MIALAFAAMLAFAIRDTSTVNDIMTVVGVSLSGSDCAGQLGHNFGPCPDWQRVSVEYQAGDGGGSTADAPAAAESAAPGPGTCK